jgi:type I restriction enzyme S subunit
MSFLRYPAYKNSGVEWLGEVPEHWDVKPVLAVARERDEDNKGMKEDNLLSLSYGSIVNKDINTSDGLLPESFETYQIISPGDIVLRLTDLHNDKRSLRSALATQRGIITSAYLALQPQGIESRYLSYLLRAYDVSKVFYSMGGGLRQSMKFSDVKRMPVVLPGKTEQVAISRFLDRETSKIDALIAEQQCLIELLQEKRQAVISQAVTKGLNPEAPMKDSGVEWLGEVPEHWKCLRLGHLCNDVADGPHFSPQYREDGVPFISARNFTPYAWRLEDAKFISEQDCHEFDKRVIPAPGDVLYTKGGTTGIARAVDLDFRFQVWVHVAVLKIKNDIVDPFFLAYALNGSCCYEQSQLFTRGATNQDLGLTRMKSIILTLPPLDEQQYLASWMAEIVESMSESIAYSEKSIALLQERRSALISAAVTGQIDVRGLVPETSAA